MLEGERGVKFFFFWAVASGLFIRVCSVLLQRQLSAVTIGVRKSPTFFIYRF